MLPPLADLVLEQAVGLAVVGDEPATPLLAEFVRPEGMGGGERVCSHANHRGDVIARLFTRKSVFTCF